MTSHDGLGSHELMILLAVLRLGEDAYGVTIAREIGTAVKRDVFIGRVYSALERLEARGLVSSRLGEPTAVRGGRAKRYFRVTAKGVRETREAQRAFARLSQGLPQVDTGLA